MGGSTDRGGANPILLEISAERPRKELRPLFNAFTLVRATEQRQLRWNHGVRRETSEIIDVSRTTRYRVQSKLHRQASAFPRATRSHWRVEQLQHVRRQRHHLLYLRWVSKCRLLLVPSGFYLSISGGVSSHWQHFSCWLGGTCNRYFPCCCKRNCSACVSNKVSLVGCELQHVATDCSLQSPTLPILIISPLSAGKPYKSRVCFTKHLWEHSIYWDLFEGHKNQDRVLAIQAAIILSRPYLTFLLVTSPQADKKKESPSGHLHRISATTTRKRKRHYWSMTTAISDGILLTKCVVVY